MDDLSAKINSILSDPQALQQIKGLGEQLMLNNTENSTKKEEQQSVSNIFQNNSSSDMLSLFSKLAPVISSVNKDDDTSRLLYALKPFLSDERQSKLEKAIKLIKVMKLLPLMKDFSIFDSLF